MLLHTEIKLLMEWRFNRMTLAISYARHLMHRVEGKRLTQHNYGALGRATFTALQKSIIAVITSKIY